jgi:Cu/Ag efflux protein CusF
MKRFLLLALIASACSKQPAPPAANEQTYPMTATIVSRDAAHNIVTLNNKEVPGKMEAMTMDYQLRGAKVGNLPANGTAVDVIVHEGNDTYYITDVKVRK